MTDFDKATAPEGADLMRLNYARRETASWLLPIEHDLTRAYGEMGYITEATGAVSDGRPILIVQSALSVEALGELAKNAEDLLGYVSENSENREYATVLLAMQRMLLGEKVAPQETDPEPEHTGNSNFRVHVARVEYGGRVYVIGVGVYAADVEEDVAVGCAALVCEDYIGKLISRGLLPGLKAMA